MNQRSRAFSLLELLVTLAILAVLATVVVSVAARVRQSGMATQCLSNLRQVGAAFQAYASESKGFVPRFGDYWDDRYPIWLVGISRFIMGRRPAAWSDLPSIGALQCPAHPTVGIPTAFNLNAFAFESEPGWKGSPPIQLGLVRSSSRVPWLVETPNLYSNDFLYTGSIWMEAHRTVEKPEHLESRVSWTRHGSFSNVLFADGSAARVDRGGLSLERFDDGIRSRRW